jgi:uncharacterized protein (DUF1501 family)
MNESMQTRREFLRRGFLFLAGATSAPFFLTRTAWALDQVRADSATKSIPGMPDDHILVVIQLGGGNDGLNTIVPYVMDDYYRVRPVIAVPQDSVLKLNDIVGMHPSMAKLKGLYDNGQMAVIQAVGYPNPNRSHFRSMEIWHTAAPETKTVQYGWLGRYVDNACPGCDESNDNTNPLAGINIGNEMPLAMQSRRGLTIALSNPENYRWMPLREDDAMGSASESTFEKLNRVVAQNLENPHVARLDFLSRVAMNADVSAEKLRTVLSSNRGAATYPNSRLGRQLQLVSRMIAGQINTRIYYVSIGGFDTHANQKGRHDQLLTELSEGVDAFYRDLKDQGNHGRVLTMTFSEFGRRIAENGSGGTDHGAAAPMFVFGEKVRGGVFGDHPSLLREKQVRGDLQFHTDFRSVYGTILENWLGADSAPILGSKFDKLAFI